MTCREKLAKEDPTAIGGQYAGGCCGCPHMYNYLPKPGWCAGSLLTEETNMICRLCWDREVPEENKENKYSTDTSDDIEICEIQHVESDKVNHPSHYNQNGMEVWDVIKAFTSNLSGAEAFYAGNAIKYILRWDKKNGIEDLEKAKVYIDKIIEGRKNKG